MKYILLPRWGLKRKNLVIFIIFEFAIVTYEPGPRQSVSFDNVPGLLHFFTLVASVTQMSKPLHDPGMYGLPEHAQLRVHLIFGLLLLVAGSKDYEKLRSFQATHTLLINIILLGYYRLCRFEQARSHTP